MTKPTHSRGRSAEMKAWTQARKAARDEEKALKKAAKDEKAAAKAQVNRMKRSLRGYLKARQHLVDMALGKKKSKYPTPELAAKMIKIDMAGEQKLASELYNLLSQFISPSELPIPDVARNPMAAPQLAKFALGDPVAVGAPQAQGIAPLLLAVPAVMIYMMFSTGVAHAADVRKHELNIECAKHGGENCPGQGPWRTIIIAAGVGLGAWFVWEKVGVGARVKKIVAGK